MDTPGTDIKRKHALLFIKRIAAHMSYFELELAGVDLDTVPTENLLNIMHEIEGALKVNENGCMDELKESGKPIALILELGCIGLSYLVNTFL